MWIVYGFMQADVQGPLPKKRWVKHPSDPKRHKLARRPTGPRPQGPSVEDQAERYARWLAARDGIAIPADTIARAQYAGVDVPDGKGRTRHQSRPFMVQFCKAAPAARWGERRVGDAMVTIELPNWDWVPEMTEQNESPRPKAEAFAEQAVL